MASTSAVASLRLSSRPCSFAGWRHAGGGRKAARTSVRGRAPPASSEANGGGCSCGGPPTEGTAPGQPASHRKVCHLATSTIWDEEMLEEAAQRELEHLHRTHTCLPGLGSHCGEDPQPGAAAAEQPEPAGAADSWETDAPQPAAALGGGAGGAGLGPSIPGEPNSVVFVEGARWSGGAPAELPQEGPRRWRVRFSRAPSPVVGGPTLPSAASVGGGEEQNDASAQPGQRQRQQQQQGASTKRQRKPRQQLKAGAVSLPAPEPPVPAAASEPPRSDATAAARWQEPPPLAPPMGGAAGQGAGGCSGTNGGIVYADTPSQELLVGPGQGGGMAEAAGAEAEPAPQYRQPPEVLRLFSDDPPGARYSQPAAGALDVTFRASMPVLVAWLLAERIVAPGQLAWSVLRGALPPAARRPLAVVFWALFAAAVLWPLL